MALIDVKQQPVDSQQHLTTSRGAALYIGAILGPGLLLLPGLAAAEAGPASIIAWIALLGLSGLFAAVFSALGRHSPALVEVPTVLFLTVYLGAMIAAARVLHGRARLASLPAALAVTVMLGFCGWALAIPAAIALAVARRARPRAQRVPCPAGVSSPC
jgi:hypothetical protein